MAIETPGELNPTARPRSFARNVGVSALTEVVLRAQALILLPLLSRTLGTGGYGLWAQILVTVTLLSGIASLGMDSAALRFLSGVTVREERRSRYYALLALSVAASAVVAASFYPFSTTIARHFFGGEANAGLVALSALYLVTSNFKLMTRAYFRVFLRMKTYNAFLVAEGFGVPVLVACAVLGGYGLIGVAVASILFDFAAGLTAFLLIIRQLGAGKPDLSSLRPYLAYGLPLIPTGMAWWLTASSGRYVLAYFRSPAEVGVYSAAYTISLVILSLFAPFWLVIQSTVFPLWDRNDLAAVQRYLSASVKYALLLAIPSCVGLSVLASPLLGVLTTGEFTSGAAVVPLLTAAFILLNLANVPELAIFHKRRTWLVTAVQFVSAAINLALAVVLAPSWGVAGVGAATMVALAVRMLLSFILAGDLPFGFDWPAMAKSLIAAGAMGIVLSLFHPSGLTHLLGLAAGGAALYAAVFLGLGGLPRAEIGLAVRLLVPGMGQPAARSL